MAEGGGKGRECAPDASITATDNGGDAGDDEAGVEEEREDGQNGTRAAGVKGRYWRQVDGMKRNR